MLDMKPHYTLLALIVAASLGGGCTVQLETQDDDVTQRAPPAAEQPGEAALHQGHRDPCSQSLVLGDDGDVVVVPVECAMVDIYMGMPGDPHETQPEELTPIRSSDSISVP
jgi:hypothetical protein